MRVRVLGKARVESGETGTIESIMCTVCMCVSGSGSVHSTAARPEHLSIQRLTVVLMVPSTHTHTKNESVVEVAVQSRKTSALVFY